MTAKETAEIGALALW